jgi:hypothetical protein
MLGAEAERLRLPDPARDVELEWRLREVHFDLAASAATA